MSIMLTSRERQTIANLEKIDLKLNREEWIALLGAAKFTHLARKNELENLKKTKDQSIKSLDRILGDISNHERCADLLNEAECRVIRGKY